MPVPMPMPMPNTATTKAAKQALRKQFNVSLSQVSKTSVDIQSAIIVDSLAPILKPYHSIACFMSMDHSEVNTQGIIKWIFEQGKSLYLPRCTNTRDTHQVKLRTQTKDLTKDHPHLTFHKMKSYEEVLNLQPQGKYKLREPMPENVSSSSSSASASALYLPPQLDVILVPSVIFGINGDKPGARLGHGAGFYDDFFKRYQYYNPDKKMPLLIGIGLKEQIIDNNATSSSTNVQIPIDDHDYFMDCIVSGDGQVYWINKG
ncbi:5-formyltetrahydrofolate cyclo-ligase NDAI_0D03460 [Naumovozyma dairenensis CBS 421]|uniref:5-formyltetrahydrofolate cyclo-ligase n=1 Tax=Naumovozyma dairenensis (strain ATCC 10597 / BCRC 20456 / CBS 421 / NBRC 0211 / NRRL Y-12639) TaxID=1071378 RepID=G0WA49_NAUDC|nr:hypothetical protein NDAI_0D03460 [Naumovozyma dairenensis CBS 421]CCD24660.1 hypothetical protein NDAI_0D03460 [Naumovozyma dairenensis CBS 421]